jgi:hypothetical protein
VASYSLWGPTDQVDTWNPLGYPNLKPQVSAPGTNRSADGSAGDAGYADASGTSMAAPHVAGVIALMWSAAPCMIGNYTDTETILMQTAMTTTTPGYPGSPWDGPSGRPNQATGWGEGGRAGRRVRRSDLLRIQLESLGQHRAHPSAGCADCRRARRSGLHLHPRTTC